MKFETFTRYTIYTENTPGAPAIVEVAAGNRFNAFTIEACPHSSSCWAGNIERPLILTIICTEGNNTTARLSDEDAVKAVATAIRRSLNQECVLVTRDTIEGVLV